MEDRNDEVARLEAELENERSLRLDAEAEADAWRQKTIDVKLDSVHRYRGSFISTEDAENLVNSRISRTNAERDDGDVDRVRKEVEALRGQRELLLKTLEEMHTPEEECEEDSGRSLEERLKKEQERRRAAEGIAKALRVMLADSEADRGILQRSVEKLEGDYSRATSLLAAAEDLMVQHRITASLGNVEQQLSTRRITAGRETRSTKAVAFSVGVATALVAGVAALQRMRKP